VVGERTGVLLCLTTYLGRRTVLAEFDSSMPPVTRESNSWRMAARCCLTEGLGHTGAKLLDIGSAGGWPDSLQLQASGVRLRRFAEKKSMKRSLVHVPAAVIAAGRVSAWRGPVPAPPRQRCCWSKIWQLLCQQPLKQKYTVSEFKPTCK
jgi:hypothetical protein